MSPPALSKLEAALGRALLPADRGSIASLNDMPEPLIAEARRLPSTALVRQFIEYHCGLQCRPYLPDFVGKVIVAGEPAARWRRGDVIVPALSLVDQLCMPRDLLLAPISGFRRVRIVPDLDDWTAGTSWVGAPAKARPDADYRSGAPAGSVTLANADVEPAPDVDITVRRWIASRIARSLGLGERPTVERLSAQVPLLPAMSQWSDDARIAWAALTCEVQTLPASVRQVPGFRGPDDWYRDMGMPPLP
ncbi:MAG: hypothetical protein JWP52_3456 [Rhizobacter sp.]|nr:hypothetical protein [Rhizobacter sp.]